MSQFAASDDAEKRGTLRCALDVPLPELLDLYTVDGLARPLHVKAAILQAARSASVGWWLDEKLIAAALFYPLADDLAELVFACRPEAGRYLVAIVHEARLIRAKLPDHVRIRATVRLGHVPGRRLALLCGLTLIGVSGAFEQYELSYGQFRERHYQDIHPTHAANQPEQPATTAAPAAGTTSPRKRARAAARTTIDCD